MDRLKEDILIAAIKGLENQEYKETIESIMMIVTVSDKQKAYCEALDVKAKAEHLIRIDDINLKNFKAKYGYYKGYPVIQLALDYVQISCAFFYEKYQFLYEPKKEVLDDVKKIIKEKRNSKEFLKMMEKYYF